MNTSGWSSLQRVRGRGPTCNEFKVSVCGGTVAIRRFLESPQTDTNLRKHLSGLPAKSLVCHCLPKQECHADGIIEEYTEMCPDAYDRDDSKGSVPWS